jgi:hypothetical protein
MALRNETVLGYGLMQYFMVVFAVHRCLLQVLEILKSDFVLMWMVWILILECKLRSIREFLLRFCCSRAC